MYSNYWTHGGGLAEVIGVLPSKDQADILVAKYADAVDGVYPMIEWDYFQRDYDAFWALKSTDRRGKHLVIPSPCFLAAFPVYRIQSSGATILFFAFHPLF